MIQCIQLTNSKNKIIMVRWFIQFLSNLLQVEAKLVQPPGRVAHLASHIKLHAGSHCHQCIILHHVYYTNNRASPILVSNDPPNLPCAGS